MNIHAVALDVTRHYNLAEEDKPLITRILDVFIYNPGERHHACEITPSYWLEHVYTTVETAVDTSDEDRERLDLKYAHEPTEDCYMHISDVEKVPEDRRKDLGEFESLEEAREYAQGNCPF